MAAVGLSNTVIGVVLLSLALLSVGRLCWNGRRNWRWREAAPFWLFLFSYYLLLLAYTALPDLAIGSMSAHRVMSLSMLDVDNFIPYNFSRYILERIDPNDRPVVPQWQAGERGPLAGILAASALAVFQEVDGARWMDSRPEAFVIAHCTFIVLNLLAIVGAALLAREISAFAMWCTVLILASTYFVALNTFYSWPKFFMAAFVCAAVAAHTIRPKSQRHAFVVGLCLGGAVLAHDMGIFYVAAFVLRSVIGTSPAESEGHRISSRLRNTAALIAGALSVSAPWFLTKALWLNSARRGIAYHLLCSFDLQWQNASFSSIIARAVETFAAAPASFIGLRLANLVYPFRVDAPWTLLGSSPLAFLSALQPHVFQRLVFGVGPVVFALFGVGLVRRSHRIVHEFALTSGFALVAAAFTAGCLGGTSNHVWAYPAFLAIAVGAGAAVGVFKRWRLALLGACVFSNAIPAILFLYFQPALRPFMIRTGNYQVALATLLLLVFLSWAFGAKRDAHRETTSGVKFFGFSAMCFTGLLLFAVSVRDLVLREGTDRGGTVDVSGDSAADLILFRQGRASAEWFITSTDGIDGATGTPASRYGITERWECGNTDGIPVPADYNGDGLLDLATFTSQGEQSAKWTIRFRRLSESERGLPDYSEETVVHFGAPDSVPVPADYDGDGAANLAVYQLDLGDWELQLSTKSTSGAVHHASETQKVVPNAFPVSGDFDGDGQAELALIEESMGGLLWRVYRARHADPVKTSFGLAGDIPVRLDADCDGTDEIAVYRESTQTWHWQDENGKEEVLRWGIEKSLPTPDDYDGDGCIDLALYQRRKTSEWFVRPTRISDDGREILAGAHSTQMRIGFGRRGALPPVAWQRLAVTTKLTKKSGIDHP